MISIEQIRNNSIYIKERLSLKGEIDSIDSILSLDKSYRSHISKSNELRAKRNQVSDKIAEAKKLGKNADSDIKDMREVGDKIKSLESIIDRIKYQIKRYNDILISESKILEELNSLKDSKTFNKIKSRISNNGLLIPNPLDFFLT